MMDSSTVEGPRIVREDEFDELFDLLDRCFGGADTTMAERNPNAYDPSVREYHAVITVDGEIASHAACVPQQLDVGEDGVACHAIGGVGTDERHRGKGYMSRLLEFWLAKLDSDGVPLVELGGDRRRYRRFEWENAGRKLVYSLTERSFDAAVEQTSTSVERYRGGEKQLSLATRLHAERTPRVTRSRETHDALLLRPDVETLLWRREGEAAYLTVTAAAGSRDVLEFGGNRSGFESLLGTVLSAPATDELKVYGHPADPLLRSCRSHAAGWHVQPNRKQNVRDLKGTLTGFEPQLSASWRDASIGDAPPLRLAIEGEQRVELQFDADGVMPVRTDEPADVTRSRPAMADLLFGFPDVHRDIASDHPALAALFPLEFYVTPLEAI